MSKSVKILNLGTYDLDQIFNIGKSSSNKHDLEYNSSGLEINRRT